MWVGLDLEHFLPILCLQWSGCSVDMNTFDRSTRCIDRYPQLAIGRLTNQVQLVNERVSPRMSDSPSFVLSRSR
jgi:hypothetical protein